MSEAKKPLPVNRKRIAAALLVAEIERIDRMTSRAGI